MSFTCPIDVLYTVGQINRFYASLSLSGKDQRRPFHKGHHCIKR